MVDLVFLKSGRRFSVRFSDQHARNPVVKEAEPRSGHEHRAFGFLLPPLVCRASCELLWDGELVFLRCSGHA